MNLAAQDVDVDDGGTEEWLDDRRTHGVAELREKTPYRGAIPMGARGGLGVNREIAGGLEAEELGVNIVCRQAHQPGCRRPDPLPLTYCMRQSMLPPTECGVFLYVYTDCGLISLARLRPVRGRRTRIKYVIGLTGLAEAFRHSWYQSKKISGMADRRDWGGGGDDPEESTQRMIERIWESLTDIQARMDQQAPVPPVAVPPGDGEAVSVAPVPPRVEVPFVAPVPPPPPLVTYFRGCVLFTQVQLGSRVVDRYYLWFT
ncbi:hypothetical protein Taro_010920 [Colocasia esculenta]|uniref:Uncharacterized protein n=1 Tax=Colocasia esculenta TaxID=4460 RepID=A0A843U4D3_COLES|nr:hypothetical protein [Colocasia esculenta]